MATYLIVFAGLLSLTQYAGSRVVMSLFALELGVAPVFMIHAALMFGGAGASGRRPSTKTPYSKSS